MLAAHQSWVGISKLAPSREKLSGPWRGQGPEPRGSSGKLHVVDPQRNPRHFSFHCHNQTHLSSQIAELQCVRAEQSPMRLLPLRQSPSQSRARGPRTEQAPCQSVQGQRRINIGGALQSVQAMCLRGCFKKQPLK